MAAGVRRLGGRAEVHHAAHITAASVVAQIILLATTPILSRLYSPEDFGRLGLLVAFMTIGGGVAAFSFHLVILLPRSQRMAAAAYRLSIYLTPLGAALATLAYGGFILTGHRVMPDLWIGIELALVAVGVIGASNFSVLGTALWRENRYGAVALSRLNLSLITALAQLGLGALGFAALGLQCGRLLGQMLTNAIMVRHLPSPYRLAELLRPRAPELILVARRYRDTLVHIPKDLLQRAGTGLPAALMLAAYGPTVAGLYFFAERVIERPGILLGDTLTRLPMKIFAERVREGRPILRAALLYTAVSTALVAGGLAVLAIGGRWLFGAVFGEEWAPVADYANALALGAGVRVGTLPLAALVPVLRIQRSTIILDLIFFLRVIIIPMSASQGLPPLVAVWAIAISTILYIVSTIVLVIVAAKRYDISLTKRNTS
jgi:O-antigen/teichoic acid export membrane protein